MVKHPFNVEGWILCKSYYMECSGLYSNIRKIKNADVTRTTQNVRILRANPFFQALDWQVNNDKWKIVYLFCFSYWRSSISRQLSFFIVYFIVYLSVHCLEKGGCLCDLHILHCLMKISILFNLLCVWILFQNASSQLCFRVFDFLNI